MLSPGPTMPTSTRYVVLGRDRWCRAAFLRAWVVFSSAWLCRFRRLQPCPPRATLPSGLPPSIDGCTAALDW
jgi:hypothetical protein